MFEIDPAEATNVRILIADDQPIFRDGLGILLAQHDSRFEIVDRAADGQRAVQLARDYRPDVVLMDLEMPRSPGIDAIRKIVQELPGTKVIVLTTFALDDLIFESISAGASAYLLKESPIHEIARTIRAVLAGQAQLSPAIATRILEEFKRLRSSVRRGLSTREELTNRENEILNLIVEGKSNAEIGLSLNLAEGTVKNYVSVILSKCQVKNRAGLIARLITP
ncbi:response regulator transcription factor [Bradyrhizobium sp. SZCCHNS2005]|uniref:response regulator transcription factor n=1 Tax=Bradyrhizobium sp. SZCCHNS2005 TaxID=3057303 RepID=UPI0028EDEEF4|nr:response regulator transcription factor [Bradyrhizobium sp. SZCCHNS2005]